MKTIPPLSQKYDSTSKKFVIDNGFNNEQKRGHN